MTFGLILAYKDVREWIQPYLYSSEEWSLLTSSNPWVIIIELAASHPTDIPVDKVSYYA